MRTATRWVALAAVLPAALVFAGCDKTIDAGDLESKIKTSVESTNAGVKVKKVDCPSDITAKKGKKFTCTVTAANGASLTVAVTLLDGNGKFSYAPATTSGAAPTPTTPTP